MQTTEDAKSIYEKELKESLEQESPGQYVAIVSASRRHFVRSSFLEAALAAREAERWNSPSRRDRAFIRLRPIVGFGAILCSLLALPNRPPGRCESRLCIFEISRRVSIPIR